MCFFQSLSFEISELRFYFFVICFIFWSHPKAFDSSPEILLSHISLLLERQFCWVGVFYVESNQNLKATTFYVVQWCVTACKKLQVIHTSVLFECILPSTFVAVVWFSLCSSWVFRHFCDTKMCVIYVAYILYVGVDAFCSMYMHLEWLK